MRYVIAISLVCVLVGAGLVCYSMTLPIYTDSCAPERLSNELASHPEKTRFKEWYSRLGTYETPYKRLSDEGRGTLAAGIGLLCAVGVWALYHGSDRMRRLSAVMLLWLGLWFIRIPLTMWYYWLRALRFDYPIWGDSIPIPIMTNSITWIIGAVISSGALALLVIRHPLPEIIRITRPLSIYSWVRAAFITAWLGLNCICVKEGILDGDEGMVFSPMVASVILLAFLGASDSGYSIAPPDEATEPSVGGA